MITIFLITAILGVGGTNLDTNAATLRIGSWLPRLGGTVTDGGGSVDLETNIDLRKREDMLLFEFELRPIEHLTLSLTAFDFSTNGSGAFVGNKTFGGIAFNNGNLWSAKASMQSVALEAAWDYWRPYPRGDKTMLTFSPVGGVQWYLSLIHISEPTRPY